MLRRQARKRSRATSAPGPRLSPVRASSGLTNQKQRSTRRFTSAAPAAPDGRVTRRPAATPRRSTTGGEPMTRKRKYVAVERTAFADLAFKRGTGNRRRKQALELAGITPAELLGPGCHDRLVVPGTYGIGSYLSLGNPRPCSPAYRASRPRARHRRKRGGACKASAGPRRPPVPRPVRRATS